MSTTTDTVTRPWATGRRPSRCGVQVHPHPGVLRDQLNLEPKQPDSKFGWTQ